MMRLICAVREHVRFSRFFVFFEFWCEADESTCHLCSISALPARHVDTVPMF